MVVKVVLFICSQALMLQTISGQCIEADLGIRLLAAYPLDDPIESLFTDRAFSAAGLFGNGRFYSSSLSPIAAGCLAPSAASASHQVLPVSSVSVIAPNGVTVASENAYNGDLGIHGALPFLGTMSLEGALPNIGIGTVAYNCGNGAIAILAENIGAADIVGPFSYGGDTLGYDVGSITGCYDCVGCEHCGLI